MRYRCDNCGHQASARVFPAAKDDAEARKKELAVADKKATELSTELKAAKEDVSKKTATMKDVAAAKKDDHDHKDEKKDH